MLVVQSTHETEGCGPPIPDVRNFPTTTIENSLEMVLFDPTSVSLGVRMH